jgi:hypothetical protein
VFARLFIVLLFMGCAGPGGLVGGPQRHSQAFQAGYDEAWEASLQTLRDNDIEPDEVNKEAGKISTHWHYREMDKRMGLLLGGYWKERRRIYISLAPKGNQTEVSIWSRLEEKRPGGTQAYRWQRAESTGELEKELLSSIQKVLVSRGDKEGK